MKRTNIMLTERQHKKITGFAKKQGKTLGELVRDAIDKTYEERDALEHRKTVALEAYQEGFISIGKLSEILGIDAISARLYLKKHGIVVKAQDFSALTQDAANA